MITQITPKRQQLQMEDNETNDLNDHPQAKLDFFLKDSGSSICQHVQDLLEPPWRIIKKLL